MDIARNYSGQFSVHPIGADKRSACLGGEDTDSGVGLGLSDEAACAQTTHRPPSYHLQAADDLDGVRSPPSYRMRYGW